MSRQDVYAVIDGERAYQDSRWGGSASNGRPGAGERTLDEYCLYIVGYADDLKHIASHEPDPIKKLEFVRKVAALCVACMEEHGAVPRR
jgi:hypothetical protein